MSTRRTAVIAIHGVGDHLPFVQARRVADMLENLKDGPGHPRYTAFSESTERINVSPVKVAGHAFAPATAPAPAPGVNQRRTWGPLDALYQSKREIEPPAEAQPCSLDHLFMEGQLAEYKGDGPENTYEVLRLEGKRLASAPVGPEGRSGSASDLPEEEIHIYDMFWSDLSGVGAGGLRIFGELYQLLFHLTSVGVNNIKAAGISLRAQTKCAAAWDRFSQAQTVAAALLAWPIPLLNLIVAGLAAGLLVASALSWLSPVKEAAASFLIIVLLATATAGFALSRKGMVGAAAFRLPVIALFVLGAATGLLAWKPVAEALQGMEFVPEASEWVVMATVLAASAVVIWRIVIAYDKRRPGTRRGFAWIAGLLAFVFLLHIAAAMAGFFQVPLGYAAITWDIRLIETSFWLLIGSWSLFWLATVAAFVFGSLAVQSTEGAARERARRINWTARLTLGLPSVLFLLITFAGWTGILRLAQPILPPLQYQPLYGSPQSIYAWADNALLNGGVAYVPVLLLLVCVAGVITAWAIFPSVLAELSPPRGRGPKLQEQSQAMGSWLDHGFQFMRWAGRALYLGVMLLPASALLLAFDVYAAYQTDQGSPLQGFADRIRPFSATLGAIVTGASVGLLGFGGRFSKLALGFRPFVRVALDVDNWLREHPRDSNPTARICGRYASLLRHIGQWQGSDQRGYDSLIIFAHSQGTVITSDLLRFLHIEAVHAGSYQAYDPTLAWLDKTPVTLFTVGCPLRQLYGLRFPFLYGYALDGIQRGLLPDPRDSGLQLWVNAYRTGDYIGRYLWRDQPWLPVGEFSSSTWDPAQNIPKNLFQRDRRVEFSIGPGAHLHYWDSTAEPIAEMLDVLIAVRPKAEPSEDLKKSPDIAVPMSRGSSGP
jgi:hypothetical protein